MTVHTLNRSMEKTDYHLVIPSQIWSRAHGVFPPNYTPAERRNLQDMAELYIVKVVDDYSRKNQITGKICLHCGK
jgi:hypothetical protein